VNDCSDDANSEQLFDDAMIERIAERVVRRLRAKPCELRRRDRGAPSVSCRLSWSDAGGSINPPSVSA